MRVWFAGLALAVLLSAAASAAPDDFASAILAVHNRERAAVGVPPLAWSDTLAKQAQAWADHLGQLGHPQHSTSAERGDEGENLWAGTPGGYAPTDVAEAWASEKSGYHYGPFAPSAPGAPTTGHYTQMIWRATTAIGCAKGHSGDWDLVVCRYAPAGNLVGQKPY